MNRLDRILQIIKNYGPGFLLFRIYYLLERKTGWQKHKFPMRLWDQIHLEEYVRGDVAGMLTRERKFFFTANHLPVCTSAWHSDIIKRADEILHNRFFYFFNHSYSLGDKPDWFRNPVTGKRADSARHWCELQDFDPDLGDIKYIWEPSRFAWAYLLVRAFAVTGDNKYPAKFWELFEDWLENNQPNRGPNYYCGQECALRLMAICFAGFAFNNAAATSTERKFKLFKAIAVHAERIDGNIRYAISTRTNHALTEATGLYTAGLLFPEFKQARRWRRRGKAILVNTALKQIFADGAYIQHSLNYHRLMLHTILWSLRLGQVYKDTFPETFINKVKKAVDFLYQMQDGETGRVPNYGSNDGSIIVPLNTCDYLDYRPVIQALYYQLYNQKLYPAGPWDEDLLWYWGENASTAVRVDVPYVTSAFNDGGYYTLRGALSWGLIRCHSFKTRPGQADCLHLDLWWRGVNVLRDSGSYLYNTATHWRHFFNGSGAHNTIMVDDAGQMSYGERFIMYDWLQTSRPVMSNVDGNPCFAAARFGFKRLGDHIVHHRSVMQVDALNCWIIVDDITGQGRHKVTLHWQLADCMQKIQDNSVRLDCAGSPAMLTLLAGAERRFEYHKGNESLPAGFDSLYYGERKPSPVIIANSHRDLPVRYITVISLGNTMLPDYNNDTIVLADADNNKYYIQVDRVPSLTKTVFNIN